MLLDPLILLTIAIGLGLMLLFAAYHKFSDLVRFKIVLIEYQLIPDRLVGLVAVVIPVIEMLLGIAWLARIYFHGLTAVSTAILLLVYAFAISINIIRGRVHFDCGCGFGASNNGEHYLSVGLVFRNIVLAALAVIALIPSTSRDLSIGDYLTLMAVLMAAALLTSASHQLLANRSAINTWRKAND